MRTPFLFLTEVVSWRGRTAAWLVIISSFALFCLLVTRQFRDWLVIWPWEAIRRDKKWGHIWETGYHTVYDTYLQLTDVKLCGYPLHILLSHWDWNTFLKAIGLAVLCVMRQKSSFWNHMGCKQEVTGLLCDVAQPVEQRRALFHIYFRGRWKTFQCGNFPPDRNLFLSNMRLEKLCQWYRLAN